MKLNELIDNVDKYYPDNFISEDLCLKLLINDSEISTHKYNYFVDRRTKIQYKNLTQSTLDEANRRILQYFNEINRSLFFFLGANYKDIIPEEDNAVNMPLEKRGGLLDNILNGFNGPSDSTKAKEMAKILYQNARCIRNHCINYFERAVEYLIQKGKTDTKMEYEWALYKAKMICPECGRQLKAKFGKGKWFLGCSGYPNCIYTRKYIPVPKK